MTPTELLVVKQKLFTVYVLTYANLERCTDAWNEEADKAYASFEDYLAKTHPETAPDDEDDYEIPGGRENMSDEEEALAMAELARSDAAFAKLKATADALYEKNVEPARRAFDTAHTALVRTFGDEGARLTNLVSDAFLVVKRANRLRRLSELEAPPVIIAQDVRHLAKSIAKLSGWHLDPEP